MATKIFSAYNALLAQIQAALPALDGVGDVFDGPQGGKIPTDKDLVYVGCDDPLTSSTVTAVDNGTQTWLDLGAYDKTETFTIFCSYVAWTGDNGFADCRARAETNIALIETALRPPPYGTGDGMLGTPTVQGPLGPTGWCSFWIGRFQQVATSAGPALHVLFAVDCTTRI